FSDDGCYVVEGGLTSELLEIDAATGELVASIAPPHGAKSDDPSPTARPMLGLWCLDANRVLSVSPEATRIWDLRTHSLLRSFGPGLEGGDLIAAAGLSPDGRFVAYGCAKGTVLIWDVATGVQLDKVSIRVDHLVPSLRESVA